MSHRDQQPYCEATDKLPGGASLYALHNLTADDLLIIQDALSQRLALGTIRLQDRATPPNVAARLRASTTRTELLTQAINNRHHVPGAKHSTEA